MRAIMSKFGFFTAILFTSFTVHAGEEGLGFSRLDSAGTPKAIANAGKSVFRIKVVSFQKGDEWDLTNPKEFANLQSQIAKLDKIDQQIAARQMSVCKADKEEKECLITLEGQRGTAFFLKTKDKDTVLMTAAHVVNNAFSDFENMRQSVKEPKQKEIFKEYADARTAFSRLIYIFDQKGNLVLSDGFDDQIYVTLAKPPSVKLKNNEPKYNESTDVAYIFTNKDFSQPALKVAEELPAAGSILTSIGYPACTGCDRKTGHIDSNYQFRARAQGQNSNGQDIYYVNGTTIDRQIGLNVMELSILKLLGGSENLIFRSGDNHAGMSGGPTVNEKGEVVGVNTLSRQVANPQVNMNASVIFVGDKLKALFKD